jgi:hypothetical protein
VSEKGLTDGDRTWLQGNFDKIDTQLRKQDSDAHKVKEELIAKIGQSRKDHEAEYHDPVKTWGLIATIIAVATALFEGLKWLLKKGL